MSINSFDDYPMSWKPDLSQKPGPKYLALVSLLEEAVKNETLKAGTKLPPQRELADYLNVNLSTVSRAFKLCEQKGLLSASVGNGTYISADVSAETILLCGQENPQIIEMGALVPQVPPHRRVKQCADRLLRRPDGLNLFSYQAPGGTARQREAGAAWFARSGFHTDRDHVLLAAGGQNALTAAMGAMLERGEKLGTDPLTYPGVKSAAKLLGIQLISIQQDRFEMTEEKIRYAVQNEKIKGLYVIPDYHNPTARIMSLATRKMIARLAREKHLLVIEDGINNLLEENPLPPIASFAPDQVIYLSSLSKTIAAGLRTAFIHVPQQYYQSLSTALYSMNISVSPLLASIAAELIEGGDADEIIGERRQDLIRRNAVIDEVLAGFVLESGSTSPLRYIRLPDAFTGISFERCAKQAGVQVYGSERFSVGTRPAERAVRISVITPPTVEVLKDGAKRLRALLT